MSSLLRTHEYSQGRARGVWALLLVATLGFSHLGCASTAYVTQSRHANEEFAKAKALGAERYSPYEYYGAEVRLLQSKYLAAEAEYGTAIQLVKEATRLSTEAIDKTNKQREGDAASTKGPSP